MTNKSPDAASSGEITRLDPVYAPDAAFFWDGVARGELLGQRCADCKLLAHPPRPMCPKCHSTRREQIGLSGYGTVYSWIVPRHPAPIGFAEPPVVALIELEEGIRLVSNLVDIEFSAVRRGLPVEVRFVPTRGGRAVPVFTPRLDQ